MSSFAKDTPKTWVMTTLGEAYQIIGGGTPSTEVPDYWGGDTPWITSADIEGVREIRIRKYVTEEGITGSTTSKVPPRTLLVVTRVGLGKIAIAETSICFSQDLQGLIQDSRLIYPELTLYLLSYELQILKFDGRGTTISGITKKQLKDLGFPLPPINEQHRIVAKIEELFSELDKGIESLKTARAHLKVYRQALLKHAFEGKLTAQWRAENQDKLETAEALQKRIQQERAQRYQQQLADWEAAGKQGSKPKAPKPLPPLTAEELAELPELPEGWGWVKLGQVFNVYVGSTPSRKRADFWNGDISWVSSGEVAFCRIKKTKEKISKIGYENASTEIHPVGTVMLAMIGEGKTRGQAAILDIEASHNQNTAAIRVSESGCSSGFVYQYLVYQYEITRKIGSGNNQKALNKERVSDLIFPLCSIAEMDEVARCIDEKLSIADQLDQTLTTSLQQAEALRQSILKKAFSGQLVPQDPHDEPAPALLARIQAERAKSPQTSGRSRSGRTISETEGVHR